MSYTVYVDPKYPCPIFWQIVLGIAANCNAGIVEHIVKLSMPSDHAAHEPIDFLELSDIHTLKFDPRLRIRLSYVLAGLVPKVRLFVGYDYDCPTRTQFRRQRAPNT